MNVDHLPPAPAVACVRERLLEVALPPFDAAEPARFSLSVSL
jgi:hypothetical protein